MARRKVTAAPVLADWAAVDGALRDIRECEHALTELGVDRDRRIDAVRDEYRKMAEPLQNRLKKLGADVEAYVDAHRAELSGKSRKMNFGVVGYRISSKLMLPAGKVAEAIATLKAMGRKEFIKTTESLDREALKRQPAEFLEQIDAYVRQRDEFYYDTTDEEPELT
ncbi:MAG: hypothetical protein DBX91_06385 [Subdoligranulum variabile]|nr:MAG: hypothetical protein DBX91_06385 [Subdoligranulum variabile]